MERGVAVSVSGFPVNWCGQSFKASGYLDVKKGQFAFLLVVETSYTSITVLLGVRSRINHSPYLLRISHNYVMLSKISAQPIPTSIPTCTELVAGQFWTRRSSSVTKTVTDKDLHGRNVLHVNYCPAMCLLKNRSPYLFRAQKSCFQWNSLLGKPVLETVEGHTHIYTLWINTHKWMCTSGLNYLYTYKRIGYVYKNTFISLIWSVMHIYICLVLHL